MSAEYYYPDAQKPHLRVHIGGITFIDQSHRQHELQKGVEVQTRTVRTVLQELQALGTERAIDLMEWIEEEFHTTAS